MKVVFVILFLLTIVFLSAQNVNGILEDWGDYKIVKVWGTHYERGYAEGYLLAENITNLAKNYFISYVFYNNSVAYENVRTYFLGNFQIEPKYLNEANGIINGIRDAGANIFSEVLQRNLDSYDILLSSSITDISAVFNMNLLAGCCSLSSWGTSTASDLQLAGSIVITRHVDWSSNSVLLDNHLLLVQFPAEADELPWISFTYPGFMGALSAININGLSSFMDMANNNSHPYPSPYYPTLLTARDGIESYDYNSNGITDFNDFTDAISTHLPLSGSLFHLVFSDSAVVVESNNQNGVAIRTLQDNNVQPVIEGSNLVLTNHFRKLYEPVYCYRYQNFADSLNMNFYVSPERSSNLTSTCAGVNSNIQKIQYLPSLNKVKWAVAKPNLPAYQNDYFEFEISELFEEASFQDNSYTYDKNNIIIYPNPVNNNISLKFSNENQIPQNFCLQIYNLKGAKVGINLSSKKSYENICPNIKNLPSGIYFYKFISENCIKKGKFIIIH